MKSQYIPQSLTHQERLDFLEDLYRLDLKCTPPNKPCGKICIPPDSFCESEGKINPKLQAIKDRVREARERTGATSYAEEAVRKINSRQTLKDRAKQARASKVGRSVEEAARNIGSKAQNFADEARFRGRVAAGQVGRSKAGQKAKSFAEAAQAAGGRAERKVKQGFEKAKQTGKKLSESAKKGVEKAKKYVKKKVKQVKNAVKRGTQKAKDAATPRAKKYTPTAREQASAVTVEAREERKRRDASQDVIWEVFDYPVEVMSAHLDSESNLIATGICDGFFYVFREDGENGYLTRIDSATNEINDFAQGYLDAIGVRLDGLTDSPYEALKGVVDGMQRFDRKLNCTPPNKPCGRICIPPRSECDIEGQDKSIAKATLKGQAIGYGSTGVGLFSPAGAISHYAGGKIAKRKRIEQLQKEALATTRKEKKALERERIVGGAESRGAAKGALIAGAPGAIVGGKLAKRSAIKKLQKQEEARSKTLAGKVEKAVDEGEETIKKVGSSIAKKLRRR